MKKKPGSETENIKDASGKADYKTKLRRYRMAAIYRVLMVMAVLAILIAVVYVQYRKHVYTDYDLLTQVSINKMDHSRSVRLGDCILTYSNDGAHCTDGDGVEIWNQSFEMQSLIYSVNGSVAAIADYNGREVYVLDTKKRLCQISTTMPIKNIAVSAQGRTAVAVTDDQVTRIYIYEPDGKMSFEKKMTMSQSGYPVDFCFSPNGDLLGVSCIYVDAGVVKSQVAFYNFGSVGMDKTDFFVNAYTYPDIIVPYIQFMSDDMAVAVGDDRLMFYSGAQIPTLTAEHILADEVQGVYQNGGHLGLLFRSDQLDMQNKMEVYDSDARKRGTYYFNNAFHDIVFTGDYFAAYGDTDCVIKTYDNLQKYDGTFGGTVDLLQTIGKGTGYKFRIVSGNTLSTVQLK